MKKLLVVLFSFGVVSTSLAQPGNYSKNDRNDRNNDYKPNTQHSTQSDSRTVFKGDDPGRKSKTGYDSYGFSSREKNAQIQSINRDFDARIRSVKMKRFLSNNEKKRIIRNLENDREDSIRKVLARFNSPANHHYDNHVVFNRSRH